MDLDDVAQDGGQEAISGLTKGGPGEKEDPGAWRVAAARAAGGTYGEMPTAVTFVAVDGTGAGNATVAKTCAREDNAESASESTSTMAT